MQHEVCALEPIFRPAGAGLFPTFPHGLRRGLRSYAASRLINNVEMCSTASPKF